MSSAVVRCCILCRTVMVKGVKIRGSNLAYRRQIIHKLSNSGTWRRPFGSSHILRSGQEDEGGSSPTKDNTETDVPDRLEMVQKETDVSDRKEMVQKETDVLDKTEMVQKETDVSDRKEMVQKETDVLDKTEMVQKETDVSDRTEMVQKETDVLDKTEMVQNETDVSDRTEMVQKDDMAKTDDGSSSSDSSESDLDEQTSQDLMKAAEKVSEGLPQEEAKEFKDMVKSSKFSRKWSPPAKKQQAEYRADFLSFQTNRFGMKDGEKRTGAGFLDSRPKQKTEYHLTEKVPIPIQEDVSIVGHVIGTGGITLRRISMQTGCRISIRKERKDGKRTKLETNDKLSEGEAVYAIVEASEPENIKSAVDQIQAVIEAGIAFEQKKKKKDEQGRFRPEVFQVTEKVLIPYSENLSLIGLVIGGGGKTLRKLEQETGTKITILKERKDGKVEHKGIEGTLTYAKIEANEPESVKSAVEKVEGIIQSALAREVRDEEHKKEQQGELKSLRDFKDEKQPSRFVAGDNEFMYPGNNVKLYTNQTRLMDQVTEKVLIPDREGLNLLGYIIGAKGQTKRNIERETGTRILFMKVGADGKMENLFGGRSLLTEEDTLYARVEAGDSESVKKAVEKIQELIQKRLDIDAGDLENARRPNRLQSRSTNVTDQFYTDRFGRKRPMLEPFKINMSFDEIVFGPPKGSTVFTAEDYKNAKEPIKTLFDVVAEEEKEQAYKQLPFSAFDEQIQWTKEGKLWHFPIDNEQGWDEEKQYSFQDHVFFDEQLKDFPKKGPVRHFMELVTHALAKNYHLSVPDKHETIEWYKKYFTEHEQTLIEKFGEEGAIKREARAES